MSWNDIFIDCVPDEKELATALASVFKVELDAVVIQTGYFDLSLVSLDALIVCGTFRYLGDFPLHIEIATMRKVLIPNDKYDTIGKLCHKLKACGLTAYKGDNGTPFTYTLVKGRNDYLRVELDPDLMDHPIQPQMKVIHYGNHLE